MSQSASLTTPQGFLHGTQETLRIHLFGNALYGEVLRLFLCLVCKKIMFCKKREKKEKLQTDKTADRPRTVDFNNWRISGETLVILKGQEAVF